MSESKSEAQVPSGLALFAKTFFERVESLPSVDKENITRLKMSVAHELGLSHMPTDPEILAYSPNVEKWRTILGIKPARSMSGITSLAVMVPPHECPGQCIYCPVAIDPNRPTPKSYTGREPSTMRALNANYDPYRIAKERLDQLEKIGHNTEKVELIVMGGTFNAMSWDFQQEWMRQCLNGITEKDSQTLDEAKKVAETSRRRVVGTTLETRPDWCTPRHIDQMLELGTTRVELGVQILDDVVYKKIIRGHTVSDVRNAFSWAKDSSLKINAHIMPGLPGSNLDNDLEKFKLLFEDSSFRPDMLKIYPCLVIESAPLYHLWKAGKYTPLTTEETAEFIAKAYEFIPPYVRVMRIQRDIPSPIIQAGNKSSNLRQLVEEEIEKRKIISQDIRSREIGFKEYLHAVKKDFESIKLEPIEYDSSNGKEIFIQAVDQKGSLYGFVRLRIPHEPFRPEITKNTGLIRELHVYGPAQKLADKSSNSVQHQGLGKKLMAEAERIARDKWNCNRMIVIAGLGVRAYYYKLGYTPLGPYVVKESL